MCGSGNWQLQRQLHARAIPAAPRQWRWRLTVQRAPSAVLCRAGTGGTSDAHVSLTAPTAAPPSTCSPRCTLALPLQTKGMPAAHRNSCAPALPSKLDPLPGRPSPPPTGDHRRRLSHHPHEENDVRVPHLAHQVHLLVQRPLDFGVHLDACGGEGQRTGCDATGAGGGGEGEERGGPRCRQAAAARAPQGQEAQLCCPAVGGSSRGGGSPPLESCCSERVCTPRALSEPSCLIATSVSCHRPSQTCQTGQQLGASVMSEGLAQIVCYPCVLLSAAGASAGALHPRPSRW